MHASPCRSSDGVFYTGEHLFDLWRSRSSHMDRGFSGEGAAWMQPCQDAALFCAILKIGAPSACTGRKQDAWFVVDPESGETQLTLTTDGPSTPRLYIGRTRESAPGSSQPIGCSMSPGQPCVLCFPGCQLLPKWILGQTIHQSSTNIPLSTVGRRGKENIERWPWLLPLLCLPGW